MKYFALSIILIALLMNCSSEKKPVAGPVVTLKNDQIEIRILPEVGGSLVHTSLVGKPNILLSDSALWDESPEKRPSLDPNAPYKAYNGHITWLSPQGEWWSKQDSFPELKKSESRWPPDPMLTLAPYRIVAQTDTQITLESSASPYSMVQFTKTYRIDGNKVYIGTSAKNTGNESVSWGLWHNTRMNGWDNVFVQADSSDLVRTEYYNEGKENKPELFYRKGYYTFDVSTPENSKTVYKAKSFINSKTPLIAGHHQKQWLIIRSEQVDNSQIHHTESRVQIYIENSFQAATDLQELEIQYPYQSIAPGASIEASETWEILPASEKTDKYELFGELREMLE
jgi:galactose mutarotase-like enzyme